MCIELSIIRMRKIDVKKTFRVLKTVRLAMDLESVRLNDTDYTVWETIEGEGSPKA